METVGHSRELKAIGHDPEGRNSRSNADVVDITIVMLGLDVLLLELRLIACAITSGARSLVTALVCLHPS